MGAEQTSQAISLTTDLNSTKKTAEQKQEDQQAQEDAPFCTACFVWCFREASCAEQFQFTLWIICGVAAVIFYGMSLNDEGNVINYGYLLCCALAIIMGLIASSNFGSIREFREVVKALREGTDKLIEQRLKIRNEVTELLNTQFKLSQLEKEQSISNAQLRVQLKQYDDWYPDTLRRSSAAHKQTLQIKQHLEKSNAEISRSIIRAEKSMLYKALDEFEKRDDRKIGLTRNEYKLFVNVLPERYKSRIEKSQKGFDDFCGLDYIMDRKEFKEFLEELVLSEVADLIQGFGINIPIVQDIFSGTERDEGDDEEKKGSEDQV